MKAKILFIAALSFSFTAAAQDVVIKKMAYVSLVSQWQTKVSREQVWTKLMSVEGLAAFTGFQPDSKTKPLSQAGDHTTTTIAGDAGTIVVTYVKPNEELRLAWDPDGGHYVCSMRVILKANAGGTLIECRDDYSDEKSNVDENAKQAQGDFKRCLETFKKLVEK